MLFAFTIFCDYIEMLFEWIWMIGDYKWDLFMRSIHFSIDNFFYRKTHIGADSDNKHKKKGT